MTSIVVWFGFLDIGLGHGLRNKFAEAKALGNKNLGRYYVSTTYVLLALISSVFFLLFLLVNNNIPCANILNIKTVNNYELTILALIIFGSFSLRLFLNLITTITTADQYPAIGELVNLINKIVVFISILVLINSSKVSIINISLIYSIIPIIVLVITTLLLFNSKYKDYRPSIKFFKLKYVVKLFNLGWKFLIIQIGGLILIASDNFIISNIYIPDLVVPYQISNRYYSIPLFIFGILIQPLWSAITDANAKKDYVWIKDATKKYAILFLFFSVIIIGMTLIAPAIYNFWIGEKIVIPLYLNILWACIIIIRMINAIPASYLNGMGYTFITVITSTFIIIINIPLSYFLAHVIGNVSGVQIATLFCILLLAILRLLQCHNILSGRKGVWTK